MLVARMFRRGSSTTKGTKSRSHASVAPQPRTTITVTSCKFTKSWLKSRPNVINSECLLSLLRLLRTEFVSSETHLPTSSSSTPTLQVEIPPSEASPQGTTDNSLNGPAAFIQVETANSTPVEVKRLSVPVSRAPSNSESLSPDILLSSPPESAEIPSSSPSIPLLDLHLALHAPSLEISDSRSSASSTSWSAVSPSPTESFCSFDSSPVSPVTTDGSDFGSNDGSENDGSEGSWQAIWLGVGEGR